MDEDDELENILADIEDVTAGRIIDMAHAELITPLTDACAELKNELDAFYTTTECNAIVNKMTVDEIREFIASLNSMIKIIRDIKGSAR